MKNFWNEEMMNIPICQDLCNNWEMIKDEALFYLSKPHAFSKSGSPVLKYPTYTRPSLDDPSIEEKLYEGNWGIAPLGIRDPKDPKKFDDRQWTNQTGGNASITNPLYGVSQEFLEKYTKWQTGKTVDENLEFQETQFPFFHEILERHDPGCIMSAALSVLTPGTKINPHHGGQHIIRCHLCLVNDEECSITVNYETRKWKNGEIIAFQDSLRHSVVHAGTEDRLVLLFDISIEYAKKYIKDAEFQSLVG
jgi:hypothetical protein